MVSGNPLKKLGSKLLHHGNSSHRDQSETQHDISRESTQDSRVSSGQVTPVDSRNSMDGRRSGHATPPRQKEHKSLVDRIVPMPLRPHNSRRSSSSSDSSAGHSGNAEAQEKKKARRQAKEEKRRKAREAAAEIDRQHREAYDKVRLYTFILCLSRLMCC